MSLEQQIELLEVEIDEHVTELQAMEYRGWDKRAKIKESTIEKKRKELRKLKEKLYAKIESGKR